MMGMFYSLLCNRTVTSDCIGHYGVRADVSSEDNVDGRRPEDSGVSCY